MRQSPFLVAAFLAFTMLLTGGALAFDIDSAGSTKPDGSPRYVDPDETSMSPARRPSMRRGPQPATSVTLAPGLTSAAARLGMGRPRRRRDQLAAHGTAHPLTSQAQQSCWQKRPRDQDACAFSLSCSLLSCT